MSAMLTSRFAERDLKPREAERVLLLHARGDEGETVAFLSFADMEIHISMPIPAADWVKRLDAGDERLLGTGSVVGDRLHSDGAVELTLPPHAVFLFARESARSPHTKGI